jgi:hypothetical protein
MNLHSTQRVRLDLNFMLVAVILCTKLLATIIPATDKQLLNGLSPYNWVCKENSISSSVNGAAITLHFKGTQQVILHVATDHLESKIPSRFPVIAWSVNGGMAQTYQLLADTNVVLLSTGLKDPSIEIYLKGTSPFEDRFNGDVPGNSLKITGFEVDAAGSLTSSNVSSKIWLSASQTLRLSGGQARLRWL